jgi:hypothetical protein
LFAQWIAPTCCARHREHAPVAQRFERWVFEDVLSSIITIGSYISGQSATLAWLGSLRKSAS